MCVNYNTLKLLRQLFTWNGSLVYAEAYERLMLNGALGVQKPGNVGVMSYLTPLGNGVSRGRFDVRGAIRLLSAPYSFNLTTSHFSGGAGARQIQPFGAAVSS